MSAKTQMTRYLRGALALLSVGALVCEQPVELPSESEVEQYEIAVSGFQADYNPTSGKVECTWGAPSRTPRFYRVYRGVAPTRPGDTVKMVSEGDRYFIKEGELRASGTSLVYDDVVGLENTVYHYEVRAGFVDDNGRIILGPPSNRVECLVGSGIAFSINDGDLATRYDTCHLTLQDARRVLQSARFSADSSMANAVTVQVNSTVVKVPWTLPRGSGTKYAYAEITYTDGRSERLSDDIEIEAFQVNFKLRNETREPNKSMAVRYARDGRGEILNHFRKDVDLYTIYRPFVEFGVSIHSDPTFDTLFDYWLVFPDTAATFATGVEPGPFWLDSDGRLGRSGFLHGGKWLHTQRRQGRLTGIGGLHDDQYKYRYEFYPHRDSLQDGKQNISMLYAETGADGDAVTVSGSLSGGVYSTYDSLTYLGGDFAFKKGMKEFAIIARFRGRYFGEDRVVISSGRLDPNQQSVSYYDAYPPACLRDGVEYEYAADGATIEGELCIDLNAAGSAFNEDGTLNINRGVVIDRGGANVTSIELLISEMPDSLVAVWGGNTHNEITLEQIRSYRTRVFPYVITENSSIIYPVRWCPINPSGWSTGWYLLTIVASDEFGNKGICGFSKAGSLGDDDNKNPQHWRIVTGSTGL